MKKILVSLLALMMLCSCTAALAEESATITLDVTPVSTPDDAFVQALGLTAPEGTETLPVVLVRTKKSHKAGRYGSSEKYEEQEGRCYR